MLKFLWLCLSIFLIFIIFLRTPQNEGLNSFTNKNSMLGSPSSTEKFLNNLTILGIIIYLIIAIQINFNNINLY